MKVGFISDIHVSKYSNIPEIIKEIACEKELDLIIIAGDICDHYDDTRKIIKRIVGGTQIDLRFVSGNHDLYRQGGRSSLEAYNALLNNPYNLTSHPIIGENFAIIGDTGWYDYSYNPNNYSVEKLKEKTYGHVKWLDKLYINWDDMDDAAISDFFINRLNEQIDNHIGKEVTVVTHFVPFEEFVIYKEDPNWDYFSSFTGSEKYGELFVSKGVKTAVFGHTHTRYHQTFKGIECICRPLGNKYELEGKDLYREISDAFFVKIF